MPPQKSNRQNIRVAVRCRPLNNREASLGDFSIVESCKDQQVILKDKAASSRSYTFDRVFGPNSKQKDIYNDMVAPTVIEVLEGYNCTIFAYGQTGTGKTYTMTGERSDSLRYTWETDPTAGIVPRALNQIFSTLESMGCDFSVRVSFLELYNEELYDLLSAGDDTVRLAIYDDSNKKGSVLVKGLREVAVHNKDEVYSILEKGLVRRQTASTQLNAQSSRSHTVFTVTVHIKEICPEDDEVFLKIGKLNLVDLAGSENIGRSGALDKRAREAGSINQSLLTLGRVITCLVDHSSHIPYRESKLTRLLQDSLGGKTKTSIIATIGPGNSALEETISTLDYAHRAKNIQNRPEINQKLNKNQLIKGYNEELERLRRDLEAARSKSGIFIDADNYAAMILQLKQQRYRIDDLESRREILESDLDSALRNFELTQQELCGIKDAKEQVDAELCRANEELKATVDRLKATEQCLDEEKYLRAEHQTTEEKLAEKTKDLISVATIFEADIEGLHDKIDRFVSLESDHRSAIQQLPDGFLAENLRQPLKIVTSLENAISSEIKQLFNELDHARKQLKISIEENLKEVDQLASVLAAIVSTNLKRCAEGVETLVNGQVRMVTDFRENTMDPALDVVNKVETQVHEKLDNMKQKLLDEATMLSKFFDDLAAKTASLLKSAEAWTSLRDGVIEENRQMRAELRKCGDLKKSRTKALVESLQEALYRVSVLAETDLESDIKMEEALAAQCDRIRHVADAEKKTLNLTVEELLASMSSVNDDQKAAASSITSEVESCTAALGDLSKSVKDTGAALRVLAENTSEAAKECMSSPNGLGKQLGHQYLQWRTINSDIALSGDASSASLFTQTVKGSKDRFVQTELAVEESMDKVGESVRAVEARIPDFEEIRSALIPRLPVLLSEHLSETIHDYKPTGTTPMRKNLSYPKDIPRTERHSLLLSRFRQEFGPPLSDFTNVASSQMADRFSLSSALDECDQENSPDRRSGSRCSSGVGTISPKSEHLQTFNETLPASVKNAEANGRPKTPFKDGKKMN
ncbi:hypothetical protein Aperf_G00000044868 [Anoplocephala perfoliata]